MSSQHANISTITLTQTFDEWRTKTNDLIQDRNELRNSSYVKDESDLTIANGRMYIYCTGDSTDVTFYNDNNAQIGGELIVNFDTTVGRNLSTGNATITQNVVTGNVYVGTASNTATLNVRTQANILSANTVTSNVFTLNVEATGATANIATLNITSQGNSVRSNIITANIYTLNVNSLSAKANIANANVANIWTSNAIATVLSVTSQANIVSDNIITANVATLNVNGDYRGLANIANANIANSWTGNAISLVLNVVNQANASKANIVSANIQTLNVNSTGSSANILLANIITSNIATLNVNGDYTARANIANANIANIWTANAIATVMAVTVQANVYAANVTTANVFTLNVNSTGSSANILTANIKTLNVNHSDASANVRLANIITANVLTLNVEASGATANIATLNITSQANSIKSNIVTANIATLNVNATGAVANILTLNVNAAGARANINDANITLLRSPEALLTRANVELLRVTTSGNVVLANITTANIASLNVEAPGAFANIATLYITSQANSIKSNIVTANIATLNVNAAGAIATIASLTAQNSSTANATVSYFTVTTRENVALANIATANIFTLNVNSVDASANINKANITVLNVATLNITSTTGIANITRLNVETSNLTTTNVSTLFEMTGSSSSATIRNLYLNAARDYRILDGSAIFQDVTVRGVLIKSGSEVNSYDTMQLRNSQTTDGDGYVKVFRGSNNGPFKNQAAAIKFLSSANVWQVAANSDPSISPGTIYGYNTLLTTLNLNSTLTSTSTVDAATPSAVKTVNDYAITGANTVQLSANVGYAGAVTLSNKKMNFVNTASMNVTIAQHGSDATTANVSYSFNVSSVVSGSTNYIPKYSSSSAIGNSLIYDSGTNIGIGTASPTYKLHVSGTGFVTDLTTSTHILTATAVSTTYAGVVAQPAYYIGQTTGDVNNAWKIYGEAPSGAATGSLVLQLDRTTDFDANEAIRFRFKKTTSTYTTNDTLVIRYNDATINGGLGIGSAPSNSYKLDISGASVTGSAGDQSPLMRLYSHSGNQERLEITNTRVAAGSSWYTSGFRIQQKIDVTWMGYIQFNGNNNGGISFGTGTSTTSATSISEAMRIDSSGNVGIGTTTPSAKLHVSGSIKLGATESTDSITLVGQIYAGNNTGVGSVGQFLASRGAGKTPQWATPSTSGLVTSTTGDVGKLAKFDSTTGITYSLISEIGGKIGVGQGAPTQLLDVAGGLRVNGGATLGASTAAGIIFDYVYPTVRMFIGDGTGYDFRFSRRASSTTTDLITILDTGRLGIGVATPSVKLQINEQVGNYMFDLVNNAEPAFRLRTYNGGSALVGGVATTPTFIHGLYYDTTENASIKFWRGGSQTGGYLTFTTNNGTERMKIANDGAITMSGSLAVTGASTLSGGASIASSLTLSYGVGYGIPYLNSNKGVITDSALTFDGTNFATTGNATAKAFIPSGTTAPTNGLYLPATNSLGFATNSTSRLTINSTGVVTISATTASTTTGTGALVVAGGVGVAGALYVGGAINGASLTLSGAFSSAALTTQSLTVNGTTSTQYLIATNTDDATSTAGTGALQIAGGIRTAKQIYAEGTISGSSLTSRSGFTVTTGDSVLGGVTLIGGYSQITSYASQVGIKFPGGGTRYGIALQPTTDSTNFVTFFNAAGTKIGSITGNGTTVTWNGAISAQQVTGTIDNATNATNAVNATNAAYSTYASNPSFSSGSITSNPDTRITSGFYQQSSPTQAAGWPVTAAGGWYHLLSSTHSNVNNYYAMQLAADFYTQNLYYRSTNNSGATAWSKVAISSQSFTNTVDIRAPIFYSSTNSSYYIQPNTSDAIRLATASGYVDIGPMNTTYSHFSTDRGKFYFNKPIHVNGAIVSYDDQTYYVNPSDATRLKSATVTSNLGVTGTVDAGAVTSSGWFESTGSTGWKNSTYNGGIYMTDSTWVKVYNSKKLYVDNEIRSTVEVRAPKFSSVDGAYSIDLAGGNTSFNILATNSIRRADVKWAQVNGHNTYMIWAGDRLFTGQTKGGHRRGQTGRYYTGEVAEYTLECLKQVWFPETTAKIKQVGMQGSHVAFALFDNGNLYTWGMNQNNSCGLGHTNQVAIPTFSTGNVTTVYTHPSGNGYHVDYGRLYIKKTDNYIYACGCNRHGQFGNGTTAETSTGTWTKLTWAGTNVSYVWNMGSHSGCAFFQKSDGTIWAAGYNYNGQLGCGNTTESIKTAVDVTANWCGTSGATVVKVSGGFGHHWSNDAWNNGMVIMLRSDGIVRTCGDNYHAALGNDTYNNQSSPITPTGLPSTIVDIACSGAGSPSTCGALASNGDYYTWGFNDHGQCGTGPGNRVTKPVKVLTGISKLLWDQVGAKHNYSWYNGTYIRKTDGTYWAAGYNYYSALGTGRPENGYERRETYMKMMIPYDFEIQYLAKILVEGWTGDVCYAVSTDGRMVAWGYQVLETILNCYSGDDNICQPVEILMPFGA